MNTFVVAAVLALLLTAASNAQDSDDATRHWMRDHSCTVDAAGIFTIPEGQDRDNFVKAGGGFQAGGGFAVTPLKDAERGWRLFLTPNYSYEKLKANAKALESAVATNNITTGAISAHGSFSAVTFDVTPRYQIDRRWSVYGLVGFGWLRRGVGFNGVSHYTLIVSGSALGSAASNSGVFDAALGGNHAITRNGLMLFGEIRVYKGMAINTGTTLVPISVGLRW